MELPFGGTFASDTFEIGTRAAAWGGTTTIVDFAVATQLALATCVTAVTLNRIAIVALLTFVNLTVATTLKTTLDIATVSYIEIAVVTGFVSGVVRWQILTANTVTASRRFTVVSAGISLVGVAVVTSFDTSLSKSIATPR